MLKHSDLQDFVGNIGDWQKQMNLPWRHHGFAMTFAEVDELDQRVDLAALRGYGQAFGTRRREIVSQFAPACLDDLFSHERVRLILKDEGLARPVAEGLIENYKGRSKGQMFPLSFYTVC